MILKINQLGRRVRASLLALLTVIFISGSLFFVTAQRGNTEVVAQPLFSETGDPQWRNRDRDRDRDRDWDRDQDRGRGRGREVQKFYCESGDGKIHWCHEGIGGRVRLVRERKGRCIEGRTWGQGRNGVWVDRGCRADFEVTKRYRR